ncbi:hypothetical protein [Micromonospora sp. HM5-17]|jgi:hypothetical protein|uniref:hypothetical protein n=1 Tax=Micromonospora sp. HM5-17 TaxID=2487710 RepID=UPI000F48BEB9|nr:hypothetical protein [Micromonospora sp. HM5-17]ROT32229.1 hypothetical protein EF879_11570 [Micromonospora sp. HM5-17]
MEIFRSWWVRLTGLLGATALAVFVPAAAWAATPAGGVVLEAARRRSGVRFSPFTCACCLIVLAVIVVVLVYVMRSRRSGRR